VRDAGADGFGREVEFADGAEEAGDVVVEALLGGGDGVGVGADIDAAAVAELGPAFALEFTVAGAYGVGMKVEAASEFAGAGQAIAGLEIAGEYGEDNLGDELAIERDVTAGSKPQAHRVASMGRWRNCTLRAEGWVDEARAAQVCGAVG